MQKEINVGYVERWASAAGGGALMALGLRRGYRRSPIGIGLLPVAGHLLYRGITGHDRLFHILGFDTAGTEQQGGSRPRSGQKVEQRVTIDRPAEELYAFWRNVENLPRFMKHLEAVYATDDQRSHWVAAAPAGRTVAWDAEIVEDRPNELIAWRSLPGADVTNSGRVLFRRAPEGRGTEVEVVLEYQPPAGILGVGVAKLFGEEPDQQVAGDLRCFKNIMETGEVPTTEGQPAGPR
jgi:uncharacterized membrane protein